MIMGLKCGNVLWTLSTTLNHPTCFVVMIAKPPPFRKGCYGQLRLRKWVIDEKLIMVKG
jgi:hypothetical protein